MHCIGKELVYRGFSVSVVTLRLGGLREREVVDGVDVFRVSFRRLLFSQVDVGVDVGALRGILRGSGVVHVFSSVPSSILASSLRVCKEMDVACVWQPVFIPGRFRFHRSLFVRLAGGLWDRFVLPRFVRFVDGLVALTSVEAEYFRRFRSDLPVEVLGECVEEVRVGSGFVDEVLGRLGLSRSEYVLSVGRFVWYKGYDLLIRAWRDVEREFPWLKLVLVGSDWGYRRVVVDLIRRLRLRNVVMLENVPWKELHALYDGCLFVVQLSHFETFHRVALEAWSHGKPVVAFDLGPATEHIRACSGGILVGDDVREVALAIKRLVEDAGLRKAMGSRGYSMFRERYSVSSYVDRLLKFYEKVKEGGRR